MLHEFNGFFFLFFEQFYEFEAPYLELFTDQC